jgi:hypothetical protein
VTINLSYWSAYRKIEYVSPITIGFIRCGRVDADFLFKINVLMRKYNTLLYDVRWLKKRKKILKRDEYKCTVCESKSNLRVHHTYYTGQNTPPWAYPNNSLLTLCNGCHEKYHREHEIIIQKQHNKSDKKKKPKKIKSEKDMTLNQLYKIWEPKIKGKKCKLLKYDN